MAYLYLLHFDRPYPRGRRPQHYMGVSVDWEKRVREHRAGNPGKGGSLTRALLREGIEFTVVLVQGYQTAREAFDEERRLKKVHRHCRYCLICNLKGVR